MIIIASMIALVIAFAFVTFGFKHWGRFPTFIVIASALLILGGSWEWRHGTVWSLLTVILMVGVLLWMGWRSKTT